MKPKLCPIDECINIPLIRVSTHYGSIMICKYCSNKQGNTKQKIIYDLLLKGALIRPEISRITLIPLTTCLEQLDLLIKQGKITTFKKRSGKKGRPKKYYKIIKKMKIYTIEDWNQ